MLVQKNADCESTASRMDAVEGIRNDDNFYAKYMAGAYAPCPCSERAVHGGLEGTAHALDRRGRTP